jgi:hypothetical protein
VSGKPALVDEPASAIAASLCLVARDRDGRTPRHPRRCSWCDYPAAELARMVGEFNEWAGLDQRTGRYARHSVWSFNELPAKRQAELVLEAQGFEPEPMPAAELAPVDEEADLPWL